MKNLYLVVFVVSFFGLHAQIVNIPDAALKDKLLNHSPVIDINNDNEIQLSEALAVTVLNVSVSQISDLTGLQAFTNVEDLDVSSNSIAHFNVGPFPHLKTLWIDLCAMQTVTLQAPNLEHISSVLNSLTTIDLSVCPNLKTANFHNNNLSSINVSGLTHLTYLNCNSSHLTTLDMSDLVNLTDLQLLGNQLTALDFSNSTKLTSIDLSSNLLTTVDASHITETDCDLILGGNPNLISVNVKNGRWNHLPWSNSTYCPNLQYICTDEFESTLTQSDLTVAGAPNVGVNTYCNFELGGDHNTISGTMRYDGDANGCDASDVPLPNIRLTIVDNTTNGAVFTMNQGQYHLPVSTGVFTITPAIDNANFTVTPASATVSLTALNLSEIRNFCVTPIGVVYEPEITIVPLKPARPGFDSRYRIVYKNNGNQILHGAVLLAFNDDLLDLQTATPAPNGQAASLLTWNFANLLPLESRVIDFTFDLNSPMENPPANSGDVLVFEATMQVNNQDIAPVSDVFVLNQTVVGAYDPNDKICLEGNLLDPDTIGGYLNYVIRFQNSGTYEAENVVVKDVIDTTKFEIGSLQIVSSSHPQMTRVFGNKVEFIFENINLPAEQDDEPASHGFVAFKIKTRNTLTIGNFVSNKADIFFDYNWPITTEPATSTFQLLKRNPFEDASIAVYPNPVKDRLMVSADDKIISIQLYDLQGRLIETALQSEKMVIFDLTKNSAGLYLVKITTEKGTKTQKIIKE